MNDDGEAVRRGKRTMDGKGDGVHLALPIHHLHCILVVFQVEVSIFCSPNHRGRALEKFICAGWGSLKPRFPTTPAQRGLP